MLKRLTVIAFTIAVTGATAQPSATPSQYLNRNQEIHLQNGQLYVNQELVYKGFSVMQTRFHYLYFYVPSRGLFTVSNHEFEGAIQSGGFEEQVLSFKVSDMDITLKSSSQILLDETSPAWVKYDPDFKLDVNSVMLGYGDKERAPYEWQDQIRKNRH
jgi:hypothetical protein